MRFLSILGRPRELHLVETGGVPRRRRSTVGDETVHSMPMSVRLVPKSLPSTQSSLHDRPSTPMVFVNIKDDVKYTTPSFGCKRSSPPSATVLPCATGLTCATIASDERSAAPALTFVARQAVVCEHVPTRLYTRQPLSTIQEGSQLFKNQNQRTRCWWILAAFAALLLFLDHYLFLEQVEESGLRVQSELQALLELTESHQAAR